MKISKLLMILQKLLLAAGMATALGANGALIPGYPDRVEELDPREVNMLPGYCKYTQYFRNHVPGGNNDAEIKRWYATMGKTFHAMHHYCLGLMKTNRAVLLARTKQAKVFYLGAAIKEFDYVIRAAQPEFILLPEILTKKAENLIRLGKGPLAIEELERAIQIKSDYWPSYAALSDYYKSTGNVAKARESLEKGLSVAPNVKSLKTRLAELNSTKAKEE